MNGNSGPIYFTAYIRTEGFTSQLVSLKASYSLGKLLGYQYAHTPPVCKRSDDPSIYQFLGLEDCFDLLVTDILDQCCILEFPLTRIIERYNIENAKQLIDHIRNRVNAIVKKQAGTPILVRFAFAFDDPRPKPQPFLLRSKYKLKKLLSRKLQNPYGFNSRLCTWINDEYPEASTFDFLKAFTDEKKKDSRTSVFPEEGFKIFVHIRQGDTAALKTPWGTYICLWRFDFLQEKKSINDLDLNYLPIDYFLHFIKSLLSELIQVPINTIISSDGYARAFRKISRKKRELALTTKQFNDILTTETFYEKNEFLPFRSLPKTQIILGESPANLRKTIDAIMEADLIVYGTQQNFIQKLLGVYRDKNDHPVLLQIHRDNDLIKDSANAWREGTFYDFNVDLPPDSNKSVSALANELLAAMTERRVRKTKSE